ncbi:hypothetical protein [Niabella hibiscisoli]|uniref:hypothetical protein n=1 Tax=Niabella hibiscisoli TaxID=1825928 RepID=UPI001F0FF16C|nr:hypothetical protein [Niabella hibiscisoli]MCH5718952.1 hypothetical protein [Niabella hibiscisoli]
MLFALLWMLTTSLAIAQSSKNAPVYKNAAKPVEERITDLVARMTLDEKVMQLNQYTLGRNDNANNMADPVNDIPATVGSLIYFSSNPELRNRVQKKLWSNHAWAFPYCLAMM